MYVELHRSRRRYYARYHPRAFVLAAGLLTRIAMLKEVLVAWGAYRRGRLTRAEWRARTRACGEVFRL